MKTIFKKPLILDGAIGTELINKGVKTPLPLWSAIANEQNYDEVVKIPENGICLASNKVNKVQGLYFEVNKTRVWGLQYHPEITYEKMISLINFRRKRLIEDRKVFENENDLEKHISFIEKEIQVTVKEKKMLELKNWLKELN